MSKNYSNQFTFLDDIIDQNSMHLANCKSFLFLVNLVAQFFTACIALEKTNPLYSFVLPSLAQKTRQTTNYLAASYLQFQIQV